MAFGAEQVFMGVMSQLLGSLFGPKAPPQVKDGGANQALLSGPSVFAPGGSMFSGGGAEDVPQRQGGVQSVGGGGGNGMEALASMLMRGGMSGQAAQNQPAQGWSQAYSRMGENPMPPTTLAPSSLEDLWRAWNRGW
jgi:hypothetical protein